MRTVYKYPFGLNTKASLFLPVGAEILHVDSQNGRIQVWALIDTDETEQEKRIVAVYGTGHDIDEDDGKYINTFLVEGGAFVFHAFEVIKS